MTVLDFPSNLEITGHALTADDNAGQAVLPFSGTVHRLAPTFERFRGTWTFKPPRRADSAAIEAFFLRVGSGRALFRTKAFQPSRNDPSMKGTVNGAHSARARSLAVTGLPPNRIIPAGEWVQVGWQAARLLENAATNENGLAILQLWPFLHDDIASGVEVRLGKWVKILWRVVGEPVNWGYQNSRHHSLNVSLEAIQEIVSSHHDLSSQEVPS